MRKLIKTQWSKVLIFFVVYAMVTSQTVPGSFADQLLSASPTNPEISFASASPINPNSVGRAVTPSNASTAFLQSNTLSSGNIVSASPTTTSMLSESVQCTYYASGRIASKTLAAPDENGMVFYSYFDENAYSGGISTIGLYDSKASNFYSKNFNTTGVADTVFGYGAGGLNWVPLAGDWNGDGVSTIGLYDPASAVFFLKNSNGPGNADTMFAYGASGLKWIPIAGDWDGDGVTTIGLYDPAASIFFLKNSNTSGNADIMFAYGAGGLNWVPIAGDWDGDGVTTIGLYDPAASIFYLKNSNTSGNADVMFAYGPAGSRWVPMAGDWNGDGVTTVGLYDAKASNFYLRNFNSSGVADVMFGYGPAGSNWVPISGDWIGRGHGKVGFSARQTASNGEMYYIYSYYPAPNSNRLATKRAYSDYARNNLVATYTYNNDSANNLYSKSLTSPDSSDVILYNYYSENIYGQGVGRISSVKLRDGTVLTPSNAVTVKVGNGGKNYIVGTLGNDNLRIAPNSYGATVVTSGAGQSFTLPVSASNVSVYGFDGNDNITVAATASLPADLYGGPGDDQLFALSSQRSIVAGGDGNDLLVSINGFSDTLIGDEGLDTFWCDTSDAVPPLSADEINAKTLHQINKFYQPFTSTTIPLTLDGQNLPDPIDSGATVNVSANPLFNNGTPYYSDIVQGSVGDCYFLSGLAGLAATLPQVIKQSITSLGDGTYGVRFFANGIANYLRIDGDISVFSNGTPRFARFGSGQSIWVMLLEKAFAFFRRPGQNTYASIEAGLLSEPFVSLMGQSTGSLAIDANLGTDADYFMVLQAQLSAGRTVSLASRSTQPSGSMIVAGHAYTLRSAEMINGVAYVTVYNPWGVDGAAFDSRPGDGLLTLTIRQLRQTFSEACTTAAAGQPTMLRVPAALNRLLSPKRTPLGYGIYAGIFVRSLLGNGALDYNPLKWLTLSRLIY